jgi:hypothetical protein
VVLETVENSNGTLDLETMWFAWDLPPHDIFCRFLVSLYIVYTPSLKVVGGGRGKGTVWDDDTLALALYKAYHSSRT